MPQKEIVKVSKLTGKIEKCFSTVTDAYIDAQNEGWNIEYPSFLLSVKTKTCGGFRSLYLYRFKEDYEPHESYEGKKKRPVFVLDVLDGHKCYWYTSLLTASEALCVSESTVRSSIKKHTKILGRYIAYYQVATGYEIQV